MWMYSQIKMSLFLINIDLLPFHVGRYCGLQSGRGVSSNGLKPDMFGRKGLLLTSWKRVHCGTEKNTSDLLWESGNYHFQCQGICSLAWSEDSMMMMTRMRKHIDIWGGVGLGVCFHLSHAFDTELATSARKSSTWLVSNMLFYTTDYISESSGTDDDNGCVVAGSCELLLFELLLLPEVAGRAPFRL